jgi:hypothetical protein
MVFEKLRLAKLQFRKLMKCFGVDVFDENYKPGFLTVVTCLIAFVANFSAGYTIAILYPDFMTMLKTTTLWGVCLQVLVYFLSVKNLNVIPNHFLFSFLGLSQTLQIIGR